MGFRFSLEHANWLAHVLQPVGATPRLEHEFEQQETLRTFVETLEHNFFASRPEWMRLRDVLHEVYDIRPHRESPSVALNALRDYFRDVPWVSLLLPSGSHPESDRLLTDRNFLSELVHIRPGDPGLILQLENVPREEIALDHVFPAFRVALAEITRWPGALVWTPSGDACFFELSRRVDSTRDRLRWLYSHLATHYGSPDLQLLKQQFSREALQGEGDLSQVKIIHLSDLHLGSQLARRRIPRVQTLIRSVVAELGEQAPIVPLITGDLMDSPNDENLGDLRSFMGFLDSLGIERPVIVLGNHDVREDGWLNPQFEQAVNISRVPVTWAPVIKETMYKITTVSCLGIAVVAVMLIATMVNAGRYGDPGTHSVAENVSPTLGANKSWNSAASVLSPSKNLNENSRVLILAGRGDAKQAGTLDIVTEDFEDAQDSNSPYAPGHSAKDRIQKTGLLIKNLLEVSDAVKGLTDKVDGLDAQNANWAAKKGEILKQIAQTNQTQKDLTIQLSALQKQFHKLSYKPAKKNSILDEIAMVHPALKAIVTGVVFILGVMVSFFVGYRRGKTKAKKIVRDLKVQKQEAKREIDPAPKPTPAIGQQYIKGCLEHKYVECPETRSWYSYPVFQKVLVPLNSGDNAAVCREAESLITQFNDFADLYNWWGAALLRMGQFNKARQVLKDGLEKTKQKHPLCNLLGQVEWKARDIGQAVYWWAQGLHCQESLKSSNYGDTDGAYLYLHYVAEGIQLSECSKAFLMRADCIRPGGVRLNTETAKDLISLSGTARNTSIGEVLRELVGRYIVPKTKAPTRTGSAEIDCLIRQLEARDSGGWSSNRNIEAAEKLGELGDPRALASLTKAKRDLSLELQVAAEKAIAKIKQANS